MGFGLPEWYTRVVHMALAMSRPWKHPKTGVYWLRKRVPDALQPLEHKYEFSKEGAKELAAFHKRIVDNLKLAFSVFINEDVKVARTLISEKTEVRTAELACADSHLARLREGRPESIETSSLHLDVLRDLKRIHSHICSVAYPVLEVAGELQPNRLRDSESAVIAGEVASDAPKVPAQSS